MGQLNPPAIDPGMIRQHLDLLFRGTAGYAPIRLLEEKGGLPFKKRLPFVAIDSHLLDRVVSAAEIAARHGAGTFVVPGTVLAPGRAKAEDVVQSTCLLVDLDAGDIAAARLHLERNVGSPTLVVRSGGLTDDGQPRLHLYWRLAEVASGDGLALLGRLRGELARKVGGDTAFGSMHQPIRLAGSLHAKNANRRLVEIADRTEQLFELHDLAAAVSAMPALDGCPAALKIDTGGKGPTASDLKTRRIRSEAKDDLTRFEAIGKVIGHWLHVVRSGRETLEQAWVRVMEHNAAAIDPPWSEEKLRASFEAILKRDVQAHGPMPTFHGDGSCADDGVEEADLVATVPSSEVLPEAIFVSEDDLADRFVQRFRRELRFVTARGTWMCWTGKVWKPDETKRAIHRINLQSGGRNPE
jgi:putative DNA primase/helicase